jgi:hypothetical protein
MIRSVLRPYISAIGGDRSRQIENTPAGAGVTKASAATGGLNGAAGDGGVAFAFASEHDDEAGGFVDVHGGVVDDDGVGGANERRDFALAVAFVALAHLFENLEHREVVTLFLMLFPAALGTNFRRRFEENFELGVREYNGADVTAFHHDSAARTGALLFGDENTANSGDRRET